MPIDIVPRPSVKASETATRYGPVFLSGTCSGCGRHFSSELTADRDEIPNLFRVTFPVRERELDRKLYIDLCWQCMAVLEYAIDATLVDRLVRRDGVPA